MSILIHLVKVLLDFRDVSLMHEKFLALLMEIEKRSIHVQIIFGWDHLSLFGHFNETDIYDSNDDHQNCSYFLDLDFSVLDFSS